jgi:membrane fusion protein, multidrug efflux system
MSCIRTKSRETRVFLFLLATASACAPPRAVPVDTDPAVKVETLAVEERPVPRALTLAGTLRGEQETRLAAGAIGRVTDVAFDRGTTVAKGASLVRLDTRAATLAVAQAEANLASLGAQHTSAEVDCARSRRLLEASAIPQQLYDRTASQCATAKAAVAAADAQAAQARLSVSDGTVRAPFAGVVIERFVNPGEYVVPASPIAELATVNELRLDLSIPEQNLADVQIGAPVQFAVPAFPARTFGGTVSRLGASVRPQSRDVVVEATVPNREHALLPGMFAIVSLALPSLPTAVIPEAATFERDAQFRVFVLARGRLEERVIQPGPKIDRNVAVLRGLARGEQVVLNPSARLRNGQAATGG